MNKLQAAMRDQASKRWKDAKVAYRVGSCFKACMNCGTKNEKEVYITGMNVMRSYKPKNVGWTYKCGDCLSIDHDCWNNAWDIGEEPRIIPRSEVSPYFGERGVKNYTLANYRKERRDAAFPKETVARHSKLSERELKIMALEAKLAELTAMLGQGGAK